MGVGVIPGIGGGGGGGVHFQAQQYSCCAVEKVGTGHCLSG